MEQEFFDQAAQRWQDMVFRLALHQLGSYADADDAVQEVFLRLWRQKAPFESEEHLRRWLLRVTVNWCRDQLRSPWRRRRVDWDSLENQPAFETPEQGELYEAVMSLPERSTAPCWIYSTTRSSPSGRSGRCWGSARAP